MKKKTETKNGLHNYFFGLLIRKSKKSEVNYERIVKWYRKYRDIIHLAIDTLKLICYFCN